MTVFLCGLTWYKTTFTLELEILCLNIEAKVLAKLEGKSYLPKSQECHETCSLTLSEIHKANDFMPHDIGQFIGSWTVHFKNKKKYYLFSNVKNQFIWCINKQSQTAFPYMFTLSGISHLAKCIIPARAELEDICL